MSGPCCLSTFIYSHVPPHRQDPAKLTSFLFPEHSSLVLPYALRPHPKLSLYSIGEKIASDLKRTISFLTSDSSGIPASAPHSPGADD